MALLLRLDSVQGAHPEVRDFRKFVTKEVIAFQEIIDSTSKDASTGKNFIRFSLKSFYILYLAITGLGFPYPPSIRLAIDRDLIF